MDGYKPRPDVARVQSFSLPEGVSTYRVQWAIGKLPLNGEIVTKLFKVTSVDVGGPLKVKLEFRMEYSIDEATKAWKIILGRGRCENDLDVPIIVRFGIFHDKAGIRLIAKHPTVNESTIRWNMCWQMPDDEKQTLQAVSDGFVFHCWLDIPKKVVGSKQRPRDPEDCLENCGSALLSSLMVNLFNEVIGGNGGTKKGSSDITLVTDQDKKEERQFHCHANILVGRSPVFQAMLDEDHFKEGKERVAKIEDISGDAMEILLKYVYTGDCSNIPIDAIPQIVHAAEKYMFPELRDECLFALIVGEGEDVHDSDWIDHLHLAEKFSIQWFKKICALALSTNARFFDDVQVCREVHPESMAELWRMVAQRAETTEVIKVSTQG